MSTQAGTRSRRRHRRMAVAGLVTTQVVIGAGLATTAQAAPSTERVSVNSAELEANGTSVTPEASSDGSVIAFTSGATNLAGGITTSSQVYVRDKIRGATELVSVPNGGGIPNSLSLSPSVSENGRFVAFQSHASNLVAGDTNGQDDVFVHDRQTGTTKRASISSGGTQGNGISSNPAISGDGRYVAYVSSATILVAGDTNNSSDVFVHDLTTRTTTRASVGTTGAQADRNSFSPSISRDGGRVVFDSASTNLVAGADTNGTSDVFVGTRTGVHLRASQSSSGAQGNSSSRNAAISSDGRAVAFESSASTLVDGDTNSRTDVFHHDLTSRRTVRVVNGRNSGQINDPGNGDSGTPSISANGRVVAFRSAATNLVASDANGSVQDIFVANLDRPLGAQNTLVSVSTSGAAANGVSVAPSISANGQVVAFTSRGSNLVSGDTNNVQDIFARAVQ